MRRTRSERLKSDLRAALEEYRFLSVLGGRFGPEERAQFDADYAAVEELTVRELRGHLAEAEAAITALRRALGSRVSSRELRDLMNGFLEEGPEGRLMFVSKWLLRGLAPKLVEEAEGFWAVPEGARVSLDVYGVLPRGHASELRILEAALFEDMALHFNRGVRLEDEAEELPLSDVRRLRVARKIPLKERWSSFRAAVTSAFFMLEAYLNSVAVDHLILNSEDISEADRRVLTEWDDRPEGGKQRFVSFRDKLLQYPRIIVGDKHPPLQESNCEPMRIIVGHARELRDAVVHPTARVDPVEGSPTKELAFLSIDRAVTEEVVDSAIELVAAIETVIHGSEERLIWLARRGNDGRFSEEVFF